MVEDFLNAAIDRDKEVIGRAWSHYFPLLTGARGMFVVNDPAYAKPILPGDRNFGGKGFLRCWMAGTQLLLIQNRGSTRGFRYGAPIACDTNFVSFCEAFHSGRPLGAHTAAFEEAVSFLLPIAEATHAFPYMVENAENPHREKVRATLAAFAAFKLTSPGTFARERRFVPSDPAVDVGRIADECLQVMASDDFRVLHAWVKEHFHWARIVLMKAALLVFRGNAKSVEARFAALLEFLHFELARLPQFEIYAAHRFFVLSSREAFFSKVQRNAANLDRTLHAMAWDLAHWRNLFEMLTITASRPDAAAFPIPHFLSFDEPFVRLTDAFQLNGLIFAANGRRCEHIFSGDLVRPVSALLQGPCHRFYTDDAIRDRRRRALEGTALAEQLIAVEKTVAAELLSSAP
jgi:hypothetical protein